MKLSKIHFRFKYLVVEIKKTQEFSQVRGAFFEKTSKSFLFCWTLAIVASLGMSEQVHSNPTPRVCMLFPELFCCKHVVWDFCTVPKKPMVNRHAEISIVLFCYSAYHMRFNDRGATSEIALLTLSFLSAEKISEFETPCTHPLSVSICFYSHKQRICRLIDYSNWSAELLFSTQSFTHPAWIFYKTTNVYISIVKFWGYFS